MKEKGEHLVRKIMPGKQPLVFPPRDFRANECGRTRSRSALSERRFGMIVFKDINIFREIALSEQSFRAVVRSSNKMFLKESALPER